MQQQLRRVSSNMSWKTAENGTKGNWRDSTGQRNTPEDHDYSSVVEVLKMDANPIQVFAPISLMMI